MWRRFSAPSSPADRIRHYQRNHDIEPEQSQSVLSRDKYQHQDGGRGERRRDQAQDQISGPTEARDRPSADASLGQRQHERSRYAEQHKRGERGNGGSQSELND